MIDPREERRYCAVCDRKFDGDTMFAEINGDRICVDCIEYMAFDELLERLQIKDVIELLERLEIRLDCIGFPEYERDDY